MAPSAKAFSRGLRDAARFLFSRRSRPMLKGTLAYCIVNILVFVRPFDRLSKFPLVYSSMMIIIIAGGAGRTVGAAIQANTLGLTGIGMGAGGFALVAKLQPHPVAQAAVFFVWLYIMSILKAYHMRFFAASLLSILMCFNGVYTSYMPGVGFSPAYLEAYFEAYLWGAAVGLGVNILVFPETSERRMRQILVDSLEHLATFTHLLAKSYTMEITPEEKGFREHLNITIRGDIRLLNQQFEETFIEINWSRYSLQDYKKIITQTRTLQQALIGAHSILAGLNTEDGELFQTRFLPATLKTFNRLRRAIDLTIRDIGFELLGSRPMAIPATQNIYTEWDVEGTQPGTVPLTDVELADQLEIVSRRFASRADASASDQMLAEQLQRVSRRLAAEVAGVEDVGTAEGDGDGSRGSSTVSTPYRAEGDWEGIELGPVSKPAAVHRSDAQELRRAVTLGSSESDQGKAVPVRFPGRQAPSGGSELRRLRRAFDAFATTQHDILLQALISDPVERDEDLRVHSPRPSLADLFSAELNKNNASDVNAQHYRSRILGHQRKSSEPRHAMDAEPTSPLMRSEAQLEESMATGHSLLRVYGFLFAMNQFVSGLEEVVAVVSPQGTKPRAKPHVHFFHSLKASKGNNTSTDLSFPEALSLLEKRPYEPVRLTWIQRVEKLQRLVLGPTGIFAAKAATAGSLFGLLIYDSTTRSWFLNYQLTGGLLTIIVCLAPTLGQSLLSFVLQLVGSSVGYLWATIVLQIFSDVGGYRFNPFGVICLILPFALIFNYVLYEKPQFFPAALLALNSAGVLIATEWIRIVVMGQATFDGPWLRMGKSVTALGVGLGLVIAFQFLVLRNPARQNARYAVSRLLEHNLSYLSLLIPFAHSVMVADPEDANTMAAVMRIDKELQKRELKLQMEIMSIMPLLKFASVEPHFSRPFRGNAYMRIIQSNQKILDRLREGRGALGHKPMDIAVMDNFGHLAPYRAHYVKLAKTVLYLLAGSIHSKSPLPRDIIPPGVNLDNIQADLLHDILILSSNFSKTREGHNSIRNGDFVRYVTYLITVTSIFEPLADMESAVKALFGELERKLE